MNTKLILLSLALLPSITIAEEAKYILGAGVGAGDYGESDTARGSYHFLIGYQFSQKWELEGQYLHEGSELNLDSFTLSGKRNFAISKQNNLYLKGGIVSYDYHQKRGEIIEDSGTGLSISGGWQYTFSNDLGLYTEYSYADLGSVDVTAINIGLSYSF